MTRILRVLNEPYRRTGAQARVIVAGLLGILLVVVGCGTDDDFSGDRVAVRTTKPAVSTPAPQPVPPQPIPPRLSEPEDSPEGSVVPEPEPAPDPPREVTYEEAEAAYNEARYLRATELFGRYTERKSENPWGYYMLGLSAWKAGNQEQAEAAFHRALELDPRHVKSYLNLSRVLLDTHRPKEALVKIDEALALDPGMGVAYRLKGRAYRQLGEMPEALGAYRRAIQIDNEDAWSMNNLGLIFIEEELYEQALRPLARAVELGSDNPIFLNNLGMALEGTGHFRAAEETYRLAVTVDAFYDKAATNLARVEGVLEDPGLEPLDLEAIARSFVDGIERLGGTIAISGQSEPNEPVLVGPGGDDTQPSTPDKDVIVVSDADSTGSTPQQ